VVVHDPQPAHLLKLCDRRKGKWIWRATSTSAGRSAHLEGLRTFVEKYDASIFSMAEFAQPLPTRSSSCRQASTP